MKFQCKLKSIDSNVEVIEQTIKEKKYKEYYIKSDGKLVLLPEEIFLAMFHKEELLDKNTNPAVYEQSLKNKKMFSEILDKVSKVTSDYRSMNNEANKSKVE